MKEVWRLLAAILSSKSTYKTLLLLEGEKAQTMLDILQKVNSGVIVPLPA